MTPTLLLFYVLAALAVASAAGMLLARSTVHAVLLLATNFLVTAVIYLLLNAPFLAAVQVIVYAGAIMVLFLFVVMLMGPTAFGLEDPLGGHRHRAVGLVVLALLGLGLIYAVAAAGPQVAGALPPPEPDFGSPSAFGPVLFGAHALAFEVVSVLLLVAMLGAVVIGKFRGGPTSWGP